MGCRDMGQAGGQVQLGFINGNPGSTWKDVSLPSLLAHPVGPSGEQTLASILHGKFA